MSSFLSNFSFNQDHSCFCLATSSGFRTFTLEPLAEFNRRTIEPIGIATMLYQTNYLALVLKSAPYKVLFWDDSERQKPLEVWSRFEILNVLLRRDIMVVVSEFKIYIYEFGSFAVLNHLETTSNPGGIAALSIGKPWILATLGATKGVIKLQFEDATTFEISAHNHPISCLAVTGNFVASASDSGTVIKVFDVRSGNLVHLFRRGTTACRISSINFRTDEKFLVAASAGSNTVHVFKLANGSDEEGTRNGATATAASTTSSFMQGVRSSAQFKLPDVDQNGKPAVDLRYTQSTALTGPIAAFSRSLKKIYVLHYNGILYEADFDENSEEIRAPRPHVVFAARDEFKFGAENSSNTSSQEEGNWHVL